MYYNFLLYVKICKQIIKIIIKIIILIIFGNNWKQLLKKLLSLNALKKKCKWYSVILCLKLHSKQFLEYDIHCRMCKMSVFCKTVWLVGLARVLTWDQAHLSSFLHFFYLPSETKVEPDLRLRACRLFYILVAEPWEKWRLFPRSFGPRKLPRHYNLTSRLGYDNTLPSPLQPPKSLFCREFYTVVKAVKLNSQF